MPIRISMTIYIYIHFFTKCVSVCFQPLITGQRRNALRRRQNSVVLRIPYLCALMGIFSGMNLVEEGSSCTPGLRPFWPTTLPSVETPPSVESVEGLFLSPSLHPFCALERGGCLQFSNKSPETHTTR